MPLVPRRNAERSSTKTWGEKLAENLGQMLGPRSIPVNKHARKGTRRRAESSEKIARSAQKLLGELVTWASTVGRSDSLNTQAEARRRGRARFELEKTVTETKRKERSKAWQHTQQASL